MRIAIVVNAAWNAYNFRLGLAKSLLSDNHHVFIIAPFDDYANKLENEGCKFIEIKMETQGLNPLKDVGVILELSKIFRNEKIDIALQYTIKPNIYGSLASVLSKTRTINNVSGLGTVFLWNKWIRVLAIALYKGSFAFADHIFFQNSKDQELFLNRVKISKSKTSLLPGSGINTSQFQPSYSVKSGRFIFLMISRLLIDKGVREYFEAARILMSEGLNVEFRLLGQLDESHKRGVAKTELEESIESSTINYLGIADDVRPFIADCHCIVLPSYREGTPRTLLEGGSMGKPAVTTNVPGCNDVVKHGVNGFLCEPKKAVSLVDSMRSVLRLSTEEYEKMSKVSRKIIEEVFEEKIVIDRYKAKIEELSTSN